MLVKDELTAQKRGKGGTLVRVPQDIVRHTIIGDVTYRAGVYVVCDLMNRKSFDKPGHVGIGPVNRGWAFDVALDEIELNTGTCRCCRKHNVALLLDGTCEECQL